MDLFLVTEHLKLSVVKVTGHRGYLYKTITSLIRALCSVPSVSVLERFNCTVGVKEDSCVAFIKGNELRAMFGGNTQIKRIGRWRTVQDVSSDYIVPVVEKADGFVDDTEVEATIQLGEISISKYIGLAVDVTMA